MDVKERIKVASIHMASNSRFHQRGLTITNSLEQKMVGRAGLEPATPRLSSVCSNQLSYRPI